MTRYGVRDDDRTAKGTRISVWSGFMYETWEAEGFALDGKRSFTLTDYNGDKIRVSLPQGLVFPILSDDWQALTDAVSSAVEAHDVASGRIRVGA